MRSLSLLLSLFLISSISQASTVHCYSQGKTIYSGSANDVMYDDTFVAFKDNKTGKDVFIIADCVIEV